MNCPICLEIGVEQGVEQVHLETMSPRAIYQCPEDHCFEVCGPRQSPSVTAWVPFSKHWAAIQSGSFRRSFPRESLVAAGIISQ